MMLEKGLFFEQQKIVEVSDTALAVGSGSLPVFATPVMITFMENTATKVIASCLNEGETSVGTSIDVKHLKATAVGGLVFCKATLIEVADRKLIFEIIVENSQKEVVGTASHTRFLVDEKRFLSKIS